MNVPEPEAEIVFRILERYCRSAQELEELRKRNADLTHELNNLLTSVLSCANYLLEELEAGHALRGEVEEIRSAGTRAVAATRKVAARPPPPTTALTDVVEVASELLPVLRGLAGDVVLTVAPEATPTRVRTERRDVEDVLVGLLRYSRERWPDGEWLLEIGAGAAGPLAGGPFVLIAVRGFAPAREGEGTPPGLEALVRRLRGHLRSEERMAGVYLPGA